ncbi:MAG: DUF4080 domain-containing protein [Planctomycetaceae bacterium]|nr:MAG: DUF4080 domain-containing protein [Planctomycetaceae bacterium]
MPDIVLTTLNAKYAHAAFGLRYLLANLEELRPRAEIVEFDISQRPVDMLESLLARQPKVVGLGVYIWNIDQATRLVADLKRVRPDVFVVLGGPEVSYEAENLEITHLADHVVSGEGDLAFRELCRKLLANPPAEPVNSGRSDAHEKFIAAPLPQFAQLALPYELYTDSDIAHRVLYVEASRGCPYECEFCLSALDIPVRQAALDSFLAEMDRLLARGARQFKFVDRTFNLNLKTSRAILEFFLARMRPGLFVHFEMIPDRLPEGLREVIRQYPPGALQFEVGIQTFNPEVAALISRRQNLPETEANLRWLRDETGVHVHADLIVGLPGESLESFAAGFDRLVALKPQEIQVGMLKRLRGTPIARHDAEWGMVYAAHAPYEILQTRLIDFATMQRLRRLARYWDLVANRGNFVESAPLLWRDASPFLCFLTFSDWLFVASGRTSGIALKRLAEHLFDYLIQAAGREPRETAGCVWRDYQRGGKSDRPPFLRPYLDMPPCLDMPESRGDATGPGAGLKRQARHARSE